MAFNLDKANAAGSSNRDSTRMAEICKAVIQHPEMAASKLLAGLELPHGAYMPVGPIRQTLKTLIELDSPFTFEGKTYRLAPVVAVPSLVKADEKKSA